MTLSQFQRFLKRSVASAFITEAEATELERRFKAGEISENDLPLDSLAYVALNSNDTKNAVKLLAGLGFNI